MKHIRILLLLYFAGLTALPQAASQVVSTQGKEFWVSFMGNGYKTNVEFGESPWVINQVLISGKRDCSGIIENPNTGWSHSFLVRANNITTIDHLEDQSYVETSVNENIVSKGLRILTTDTVSVFCTNIASVSFDASYVLPRQALSDDYMIQTYDQSTYTGYSTEFSQFLTSAFIVVATENNTVVDITPTTNSFTGNHHAGEEFSITLNAGEVFQFRSTSNGSHRDLSGTRITARDCKKIAVFNGNTLTAIPDSRTSRDLVFEQAMPIQSWGKQFVVTSSHGRNEDYVKITSSSDDNNIFKNGELLTTLSAGESLTFRLSDNDASCFIEADYPSAVFLFNTSYESNDNDHYGDPSMVLIAPIEQRIDEITFTTFHDHDYADIDDHYVNIIVKTEDIGSVYLDGQLISPLLFHRVNGNEAFSYVRHEIPHGVHQLACAHGFNAHVYGFGYAKGYAYLVGSKASNLSTSIVVNNLSVQSNETFPYCVEEPITFAAEVNLQNYNLTWDFGDGTTSHSNPVNHIYHDRNLYQASLLVTTDEGGCSGSESDTTKFYVDVRQKYAANEYQTLCMGEYYNGHGFNNVLITNDTILGCLQNNPSNPNCPDSLLIYITANHTYYTPITDSRCWHGVPALYDDHGFSFFYDHAGTYDETLSLQSIHGCDSILYLHLVVDNQITHEFDTTTCGTFVWEGIEYDQTQDIQMSYDINGCDSIVTCHLTIGGTVSGETTYHTDCDFYIWHGVEYQESGFYEDTIPSASGCDTIKYLDLTLIYTPTPKLSCASPGAVIYGPDHDSIAVITNTEFFSFQYDFFVEDEREHINDWDSCRWTISKPTWMIETLPDELDKRLCRVFVAEQDDSIVELHCTIYHHCEQYLDSITKTIYLKSSFLDIEEQNYLQPDFHIVPNPNNGQMDVRFENMTGKVSVKVYDMRGSLVDQFESFNSIGTHTVRYEFKKRSPGIYFFVANASEGTITKKVIIE